MKIFVKAKPNAKEEFVKRIDETHFVVAVKEPPVKGKANQAIARALADFFDIPVSSIKLKAGFSNNQKIFEIL